MMRRPLKKCALPLREALKLCIKKVSILHVAQRKSCRVNQQTQR